MSAASMRSERIWLILLGLLVVAVLGVGAGWVYGKHRWAAARLADIEPRYARLEGLKNSAPRLQELGEQLRERMGQYVYPAGEDPSHAGNSALQQVRERAASAQLNVTSSQALTAREEEGFYRVGLNVQLEGDWARVAEFLQSLFVMRPAVYLERMQITSSQGYMADGPQKVTVTLNLFVLQERLEP